MKRLTGFLPLVLAAGGLSACGEKDHAPKATTQAPIAVTVLRVAAVETAERLETGGVVEAQESASVSSRIVATIAGVRVKAGDRVHRGDVLVTLDAGDAAERTGQARANVLAAEQALLQSRTEQRAAEAEHRLAVAWQTRIAALHARKSATDQESDEADARLAAAAARLAGAQAGIEAADAHLASAHSGLGAAAATESFATLRAPFAGLITERLSDPGNLAAPGVPLLRIEADGPRQVVVRVDEARAGYVHTGDRVTVQIDAFDEPDANDRQLEGTVAEIARAVGVDQRTFTVKVRIPPTTVARSGSFARVVFRGAPRRALLVPAHAIRHQGQVSSVYVVQDGVARLRLIQVGTSSSEGVEVVAGLDAGETIVASPLPGLVDGATVTVDDRPAHTKGAL